jgi:hypothetical protein
LSEERKLASHCTTPAKSPEHVSRKLDSHCTTPATSPERVSRKLASHCTTPAKSPALVSRKLDSLCSTPAKSPVRESRKHEESNDKAVDAKKIIIDIDDDDDEDKQEEKEEGKGSNCSSAKLGAASATRKVDKNGKANPDSSNDGSSNSAVASFSPNVSFPDTCSSQKRNSHSQTIHQELRSILETQAAVLKTLDHKRAANMVVELHEEVWLLQETCANGSGSYTRQLDKVQKQLLAANREKDTMQHKLDAVSAKLHVVAAITNKGVSLIPVNKDIQHIVEYKTKNLIWSMVKFIQGPEDEYCAGRLLVKYAGMLRNHVDSRIKRVAFINTYKGTIRKAIFRTRNYVASQHKKVMLKRYKSHGSMPTVAQLLKCLKRDIKTDEEFEIFAFYWEELLPKQVGSLLWRQEVRHYETICEAMRRDVPSLPMITPEDEAFTVLVIQNSRDRWLKELQLDTTSGPQTKKTNQNGLFTDSGKK